MKRIALSLLALTLSLPLAGAAKTVRQPGIEGFCGTRISTAAMAYARHKFNERRRALERRDRLVVGEPTGAAAVRVTKSMHVAVIEDDGTIFPPPNLFDLETVGVKFKKSRSGQRAKPFFGGVSPERGNRISIGDDDNRRINLPFTFRFYGVRYERVFLNSDGNLTFGSPESSSLPRSLGRFLEGPPRIAVDFLDLDPSVTTGDAGVYLLKEPGRVRITWLRVPEFGTSNSNTFQVTMYPGGLITMGYEDMAATDGIVGISPGGPGALALLDLSEELPVGRTSDAIAEQFRSVSEIDDMAAAAAVLSAVRDEYDHIVLFADFTVDLDGAIAYHSPVSNDIRGIGRDDFNLADLYGSDGRLESFVQMGSLAQYPLLPDRNIGPESTGITILAHEVGHRWLSFTTFVDEQGRRSDDLLGRQMANGDGSFTTTATWEGFSPLDQYLMGLRRASQVPPFFYVTGSGLDPAAGPDTGVTFQGQRVDVTIDQIIAAEGPRVPSFRQAQKEIQVAFALLGQEGQPPSAASIEQVSEYRQRLESFFNEETGGRGSIDTFLRLRKNAVVAAPGASALAPAAGGEPAVGEAPADAGEPTATEPAPAPSELPGRLDRLDEQTRR